MTVLRVGIASYEEMKALTMAVARGQSAGGPDRPRVWFPSAASLGRVLSEDNRALLAAVAEAGGLSLSDLAARTGRAKSNLSRTLRTMERYGLVTLRKGPRGRLIAEVDYDEIVVSMPIRGQPGGVRAA